MTMPRDEITHHILRMADVGLCTRAYAPPTATLRYDLLWQVNIDGRPAPENAYWALTALARRGYIRWSDVGIGIEIVIMTPTGLTQLRAWDDELLGTPVTSTRPLSCLDDVELKAEARRLIGDAFNRNPSTRERDDR